MRIYLVLFALGFGDISLYASENSGFSDEDSNFAVDEDDKSFSSVEEDVDYYKIFSDEALRVIFSDCSIGEEEKNSFKSHISSFYSAAKRLEELLHDCNHEGSKTFTDYELLVSVVKYHEKYILNTLDSGTFKNPTTKITDARKRLIGYLQSTNDVLTEMYCGWVS